ncbi:ARID DNA-binding domain-containing protein [Tanacetum coccineum]|uniref:ARID DNA-binding domain-containing protein n=1 Tax=Tanacetum coccineum TaxID=301880 RepID=A0ABQ4WHU2_9ASTR
MVNIKRVMECNWLQMKPVKSNQHWYQSTRSDPWEKQLHRNIRVTLNKNLLQKETHSNTPKWPKHKKHISPEGKQLLRQKVEEVMSYNSSKLQPSSKQTGKSSGLSRKERRARCYICRKRGHVYWKCIKKERSTKNQEPNMTSPVMTEVQEKINYSERVHVTTDYLVEVSDKGNWNNIWYVSSAYKRHMSPMKHLFKRMIQRFKVEGTKEKEKKFLISYGVGEAFVETNEGRITVSNVLFTPEITLNILSLDQLEEQGYMVSYVDNKCRIKYMFDEMPEAVGQETTIEGEDEDNIIKSHNSFLDDYFRSLDLEEECSLIKGMEDLKMNKEDVHDYVDNEYLSMNGTLYTMKVNTFPRFISFLDLIKTDKLVYGNWEVLKGKFMEMLEWFYLGYLKQDVLGELPPVIGVIRIDLLGLYKFVDAMGGYMNVTFNDKWHQVANILGLANEHHETVKEVYKDYIGMVKVYYEEAKRSRHGEPGDVAVNCRGTAGRERPQVSAKINAEVEEMPDETPRKRSRTKREDVNMEDANNGGNYEETNHGKETSTSSSDDLIIIT